MARKLDPSFSGVAFPVNELVRLYAPTIARVVAVKVKRWESFWVTNTSRIEEKLTYIALNIQIRLRRAYGGRAPSSSAQKLRQDWFPPPPSLRATAGQVVALSRLTRCYGVF